MYLQSGVSAISIRDKFRKSRWNSLQLRLTLLALILALTPCLLISGLLVEHMEKSRIDDTMRQMQSQATIVGNQMVYSRYFERQSEQVNAYISQMSDLWSGRIQVINRDFRVIRDTYVSSEGRFYIAPEVMEAFGGKTTSTLDEENHTIYVVRPIAGTDEQIHGVLLVSADTSMLESEIRQVRRSGQSYVMMVLCVLLPAAFLLISLSLRPLKNLAVDIREAAVLGSDKLRHGRGCFETERIGQAFAQTMRRLKELDRSRQEFASNVAHELKTPMASMRVLSDSLMSMEDAPPELYREFMADISAEIERETKIIDDLLSLTRLEQKGNVLSTAQVNINDMMEVLLKRLRPLATQRDIEIYFESFRPVIAEVDESKLMLAISNLVENAIKYNHDGGWIKASLNADLRFMYIKVADSGCGIPEDAWEHIFDRFYRVDKARSRETGGTGLGLSITKTIINLHGGVIKAHSRPGEGSTFVVRVPLVHKGGKA